MRLNNPHPHECPGVADPGLPDGPGAVPAGHPDLPPHHRQLRLDRARPTVHLEGGLYTLYSHHILLS